MASLGVPACEDMQVVTSQWDLVRVRGRTGRTDRVEDQLTGRWLRCNLDSE